MKPKLYVHIGGAKCGSTSIQMFCKLNRERFLSGGLVVPSQKMTFEESKTADANQVWYFENLRKNDDAAADLRSRLEAMLEQATPKKRGWLPRRQKPPSILLSAENLSNDNGLHRLFAALTDRFDIHVLLYIRRQEDAYMSGWQQWFVKRGFDLDRWLDQTDGFFADWRKTIETWETVGARSLTVRLFDRDLLVKGDAVRDFLTWLGLDAGGMRFHSSFVNVTHGAHIARLMSDCSEIFESSHDTFFEHKLFEMKIAGAAKRPGEVVFTREQIDKVRARYAEDNAWIKARYFPTLDRDPLFPEMDYTRLSTPDQDEVDRRNQAVLEELLAKLKAQGTDCPEIHVPKGKDLSRDEIADLAKSLVRLMRSREAA